MTMIEDFIPHRGAAHYQGRSMAVKGGLAVAHADLLLALYAGRVRVHTLPPCVVYS